jgi:pimeloyl-ACP methyl ester carboxylesterase
MKLAAAVYTLASATVLALMVTRPPLEVTIPPKSGAATAVMPAATQAAPPTAAIAAPAISTPTVDTNAKPDYEREQRMADEIKGAILDGEVVTLNDGSHDFMGILTPAEQPRGAVIILHGRGYHPDWADVAHPLRVGLAGKGWTTLSLQMPALEKDAKYYDYLPLFANADKRIDAGIAFLKQKGIAPIVLAAHSCGSHMAMHWVDNKGDGDIVAYVGLGMGATDDGQEMQHPFPLDKMKVPVLDVYGENEYPQVIKTAPERQAMMQKAGNTHSKQMVLPDANHYFTDKGAELTAVVVNWLNSLPL